MRMDVFGRMPNARAGEYFRASVWQWRPIHELIQELCSDLMTTDLLDAMVYNEGAGPDCQDTCTEMAKRFEAWFSDHPNGWEIEDAQLRIDEQGRFLPLEEVRANPQLKTRSAYSVTADHLWEWVEFLRHCGGFRVC